jgi:hypothetical protein
MKTGNRLISDEILHLVISGDLAQIPSAQISGRYADQQLASIKNFTLPRLFLYDNQGRLVPQEKWPTELDGIREHAGDAYCCVSDKPAPPGGGPPPDCKRIVYGTNVHENFKNLMDSSGHAIRYRSLPKHQYLLVEYFATWCPPCVEGRQLLNAFFKSQPPQKYLWVSIDMSRLQEVQEKAKKSAHQSHF